jgi:hypothetical protein
VARGAPSQGGAPRPHRGAPAPRPVRSQGGGGDGAAATGPAHAAFGAARGSRVAPRQTPASPLLPAHSPCTHHRSPPFLAAALLPHRTAPLRSAPHRSSANPGTACDRLAGCRRGSGHHTHRTHAAVMPRAQRWLISGLQDAPWHARAAPRRLCTAPRDPAAAFIARRRRTSGRNPVPKSQGRRHTRAAVPKPRRRFPGARSCQDVAQRGGFNKKLL